MGVFLKGLQNRQAERPSKQIKEYANRQNNRAGCQIQTGKPEQVFRNTAARKHRKQLKTDFYCVSTAHVVKAAVWYLSFHF